MTSKPTNVGECDVYDDYRHAITSVKQLREELPKSSHVRAALADEFFTRLYQQAESLKKVDLKYAKWPHLFGFCVLHRVCAKDISAITELDDDIEAVLDHTPAGRRGDVLEFLGHSCGGRGSWYGHLFEIWAKAKFLKAYTEIELDVPMENGREHDISVNIRGRQFNVECTVLTEDDESRGVWERFVENKKLNPTGGFKTLYLGGRHSCGAAITRDFRS